MSRLGQHDVGHEGVITGRDALSLRSPIADPQGVAQPPLQSPYIWQRLTMSSTNFSEEPNILVYRYDLQISCNLVITRSASSHE